MKLAQKMLLNNSSRMATLLNDVMRVHVQKGEEIEKERTISVLNKLIFCTQPTKINQIPMKTFTPTYIPNIHEHLSVLHHPL